MPIGTGERQDIREEIFAEVTYHAADDPDARSAAVDLITATTE